MNYSDYRFTLDIQIHQAQVSVPVTFGDSARRLCIGLTDGRKPYVIGDGCRAVFGAKKPDGNTIKNDCVIERNVILYEFSQNTTNAEGIVNCEITIYDVDGKVLTSPQFIIVVDKRAVRDEEIPLSESESTTLDGIICSELAREEAENIRKSNEDERIVRDGERDEIITFFEDKGGIIISDEEPESDVASIWLKETPTDDEISLLTADDIVQELSDAEDKIPSVALVKRAIEQGGGENPGDIDADSAKRLQYYGDINIIPMAAECFETEVVEGGVAITGMAAEKNTDIIELVIPYEIDGHKVVAIKEAAFRLGTGDETVPAHRFSKVILPNTVREIGKGAFDYQIYMTELILREGLETIGEAAFSGCRGLTQIQVPSTVKTIDLYAFNATRLEVIYCRKGSAAEAYAKGANIPYKYYDASDVMEMILSIIPVFKIKKYVRNNGASFTIKPNSILIVLPGSKCLKLCRADGSYISNDTYGKLTLYVSDNYDICYAGTTDSILSLPEMYLEHNAGAGCFIKTTDGSEFVVMTTEYGV